MEILSVPTSKLPSAKTIVDGLWSLAGLDTTATERLALDGHDPVMPSSFPIGLAAQSSMAASALAAAELRAVRGLGRQQVGGSMLRSEERRVGQGGKI